MMREDMQIVGVREEDAEDSERWRRTIHCGDFYKKLGKAKRARR